MIRGIYTAVSGLITQEAKQDVVTNNLANANTVGYKSDNLAVKKFEDLLIANYDKISGGKNVKNPIGTLSLGSKIDETLTYFTQGMIQETDKETDFAIEGRGFFVVQKENGQNYYTRDGHFHVNMQGYLVTDSGDKVLGVNNNTGTVEPIYIGKGEIALDQENNLYVDKNPQYKLHLADFDDYKALKKVGDNLYEGDNPIMGRKLYAKNKYLERSNVNIIDEMANMMMVMRNFESNQKVIQTLDETLSKAVNEIGSVR